MPECFPPVVGEAPKVLILGTMPGRVSLQKKQYYAHPQNQFWKLMSAVLKLDLPALPYARRIETLQSRGVALWEVFASCEREGSLDSSIEDAEPAAVPKLLRDTGIKAVFCNGGTSWRAYQQHFAEAVPSGTEAFPLPSSSPAHAAKTFDEKLADWMKIAAFLCLTLVTPAKADDLKSLVDKANKALRGDSSHGRMTMTIVTPNWKRVLEVEGWNKDRAYAFLQIHAPAKDRGNQTLRRKNEMWVWMNKVERVIKVPPTMMHSAWQGSDFTYEDIVKADSIVKDYDHKLLEKKPGSEYTLYVIQADPKPDAPVVWGKVVMTIALYGEEVVPVKEEDYSERGELIRTIELGDVKRMGGRLLPARLECRPAKKPGQKTLIEYKELEFDVPLDEGFFSLSRLQGGGKP